MVAWRVKSDFSQKQDFRRQAGPLDGFACLVGDFRLAVTPLVGNVCVPEK
jgi:hypothetical protein